jgi:hypothetical protein
MDSKIHNCGYAFIPRIYKTYDRNRTVWCTFGITAVFRSGFEKAGIDISLRRLSS